MKNKEIINLIISWLKKNIVYTVIFISMILGLLFFGVLNLRSTPTKTILKFANAVNDGDSKMAAKCIENAGDENDIAEYFLDSTGETMEIEIYPGAVIYNKKKTKASVNCYVKSTISGEEYSESLELELVKSGNNWLISE